MVSNQYKSPWGSKGVPAIPERFPRDPGVSPWIPGGAWGSQGAPQGTQGMAHLGAGER